MSKPMIRIHNTETNQVIDREMTNAEYVIWQADIELQNQEEAKAKAKAQAKATAESKLAALGLTTDDLRALGL